MGETSIQWTDKTWNPTRGCDPVSPGCKLCYAERLAGRFCKPGQPFHGFVQLGKNGNRGSSWTGKVELIESKLDEPLHWKKPCRVFVNSMSDLFHEELRDEVIDRVFAVMALCPHITFQCLSKRPRRMMEYLEPGKDYGQDLHEWSKSYRRVFDSMVAMLRTANPHALNRASDWLDEHYPGRDGFLRSWPLPNVWLGVSVEDQIRKDRIDLLRQTPAAVRFLSIEPLLEDIGTLNLDGIHWVIVGGESGPGARPFNVRWARDVIAQCKAAGVACFVKQMGANARTNAIRGYDDAMQRLELKDSHGGDMDEWPGDLRVRQFPEGAMQEAER